MKTRSYRLLNKFVALLSLFLVLFALTPIVSAGSLSTISDTLSTVKAGSTANHVLKFTTATAVNGPTKTITVAYTSFTGAVLPADVTLTHGASTGLETTETVAASAAAGVWGASWSSPNLTLTPPTDATGTEIPAADKVIITVGNTKLTNPAVGVYVISIAGVFGDTGKAAVVTITDDQIPVSGTVNPTISLTVANTTLDLTTLDSGTISTSAFNNIVIGTNGSKGYTITIKDANAGLLNSAASKTITSGTATLVAGTEGYGANCNKLSGSGACTFADGATQNVTALSTTGATFASYGSKPASTETFQVRVKAAIATSTEAGSYVDTLTVIGTANF